MRRTILTLAIIGLLASVSLANYSKHSKRTAVTQKSLDEMKLDSVADYVKFKGEADVKISDNRMKIATLKTRTSSGSKEINEEYALKIQSLEVKNNELEVRINGATDTITSMWLSFMRDFNHDMDELVRAIKEMGV